MIKKLFISLAVFLLLCKVCYCQRPLGFVLEEGRRKVQIPFELRNNLIIVPVVLNGMLPLKFVVDTGVQTGILTQKAFSDILNLQYSRKYIIAGPGGKGVVEAYVTNNVSLDLPGVHGTGHALLVLNEDYLELRNYLGTDVHGILGYELFSRFIVEINYEKKLLIVSSPSRYKIKGSYHRVPITVEDTKPYVVTNVTLSTGETIRAKLMMDSGASHGLLLEPQSDPRITVPAKSVSSQIGRGIGGEIMGKVGRIKSMELGDYLVKGPVANFPDPNSYMDSLKIGNTSRNGTIGGEIMSRFNIVFNFSKEEIFLKKNSSFKKKFYYNLSGLIVKAIGSDLNTFEIAEVREQSTAQQADVKAGDLILSINGVATNRLDLNQVLGLISTKPGKRINLQINREGEIIRRMFRLQDAI
ncbi:MAG TPA: aspartyl protease family protein [Cyclobacteriaceae bacterium]|nr:aspartyl protease family protein [Cyclobacteriaceae bacterium]